MTEAAPTAPAITILSRAASLLDSVGADRTQVDAEVALKCLFAAALLESAGGRAARVPLLHGDPRTTIRAAMAALSELDEAVFSREPVLDAARAARRALRLLD
ncbi:hypothetical protein FHU33_3539 [Blastococcus colisei]|uniref:Uncharacterized protein n=1 Tax=Blastococcus colisei TaxID=1564162 RepID=A0A543PJ18_9ACTN|nr:hypothetical protein [Blastococcus colisei]TQN44057.1 hypothetical protein FHU33_3539 [Blastococcus colisei]